MAGTPRGNIQINWSDVQPTEVANFHRHSDVDSSTLAQHHTIGIRPNQASPGNHTHDGINSPFLSDSDSHTHPDAVSVAATGGVNGSVVFTATRTKMLYIAYVSNIAGQRGYFDASITGANSVAGPLNLRCGVDNAHTGALYLTTGSIFAIITADVGDSITVATSATGTINEGSWVII